MLQIKTLSCKEELAVLEAENASKRKKLEEVAALDGRTPEGARRWLQCNEKASSGGSKFKESTSIWLLLKIPHSVLNLMVIEMLNFQERAAEDFEAGVGQEAEIGQLAPTDRKYCVDFSNR